MSPHEVRTEPVSIDELRESIPEITEWLLSASHDHVNVIYGWGCNLPSDQLWSPVQIDTVQLDAFIQRSVQHGIFVFGRSDLHIEDLREAVIDRCLDTVIPAMLRQDPG